ncbi:hypothetical protein KC904_19365, partial [Enterobacter hormaechei]
MSTLTKEWLQQTIAELEEERDATPGAVNKDASMALAAMKMALGAFEAEESVPEELEETRCDGIRKCIAALRYHHKRAETCSNGYTGSTLEDDTLKSINFLKSTNTAPALVSVPDDVSVPLAHAYKELTPTFMRNHIDIFERYGIYPDGSAGIQAMRIALDGMNRRAAMLQGAEPVTTAYKLPAIGWLRADYQDDNRGLRGNAPLFVLGKKDPSTVWGLDYIPLTSNSSVIPDGVCPCCGRKPLKNRTCSVSGCDGKHVARGFCIKHY